MNTEDLENNLVCIQYPGIVNNVDRAIETLGGIRNISNAVYSKRKRLELRFRPEDPYCQPARSTKSNSAGILVKVRLKKRNVEAPEAPPKILSTEVVGFVDGIYKFDRLADFQYLPMAPKEDDATQMKSILNQVAPVGMVGIDWLDKAGHYFMPPTSFSRLDNLQNYAFRGADDQAPDPRNELKAHRKPTDRSILISFNHIDPTPNEPLKDANVLLKNVKSESHEAVKKLFEERPIWSKVEIITLTKISKDECKAILSYVAYYYLNGPWRAMWIKLGYDPRKDPSSRIYQTIDFRIRARGGLKHLINDCNNDPAIANVAGVKTASNIENSYIFRPGCLPSTKQIFYQYINLRVPEIEDMLQGLGEVLPGALCHEKRGWLPLGFDDDCRQYITNYVAAKLRELKNISCDASTSYDVDDEDGDDSDGPDELDDALSSDSDK